MNRNSQYAFYGSLMVGMDNYLLYQEHLRFLGKVELEGFKMFALTHYPYVLRTEESGRKIVAELFQITNPKTEQSIHEMELEVGYIFSEVTIADNKFGIYLLKSHVVGSPEISTGDWRAFRKLERF